MAEVERRQHRLPVRKLITAGVGNAIERHDRTFGNAGQVSRWGHEAAIHRPAIVASVATLVERQRPTARRTGRRAA